MLNRLHIAKDIISDDIAYEIILDWLMPITRGVSSSNDMDSLIEWYKERDLVDSRSKTVYRGLKLNVSYKERYPFVKTLSEGKSVKLKKKGKYSSWTVDPRVADEFTGSTFGVILSSTLSSKDDYVDINRSFNYLKSKGVSIPPYLKEYFRECEIATSSIPCESCDTSNIELINVTKNLLMDIKAGNEMGVKEVGNIITYDYPSIIIKGNWVIVYKGSLQAFKHFKRKPDTDCVK